MGEENSEKKYSIPIDLVKSNEDNPRLIFSEEGLSRLAESIKEVGILVPLTVYREGTGYVILDGERRWRAAKRINLRTIPCYVLPKPASKMEYILNMFKIHNVREEWSLLPTAFKLAEVIKQIEMQTQRSKISNQELATLTGLTNATVGRCRQLLTLPEKYQNMLLAEEKLVEKGIKPTKTTLSEDFFLELLRTISAIKSRKSGMQRVLGYHGKDKIISCFVAKYKSGNIPDITDFRYLTKLVKQTRLPLDKREAVFNRILREAEYRIDEAYDVYARPFYESEGLQKQLDKVEVILESLDIDLLDRGSGIVFLNSLENFRKIVQKRIDELRRKLSKGDRTGD
jgi:ParB family chromosome partitioning protein